MHCNKEWKESVVCKSKQGNLYGTLKVALLFWKKLKGKLEEWGGFVGNSYDPCTVNKLINNKQQATIRLHVDDLKISHEDKEDVVLESISYQT